MVIRAMLCVLAFAAALAGQPTIRVESREVMVDVAVTGRNGATVDNLSSRDFAVWEDGRPQKITGLTRAGADPETAVKHFVLFFDFKTMSHPDQESSRQYAVRFVEGISSPDRFMAVVQMNTTGSRILQNFTNAGAALTHAVESAAGGRVAVAGSSQQLAVLTQIPTEGGVQPLTEALHAVAESLAPAAGRKVVVLFTGGYAGTERETPAINTAIMACNRANVAVYVVGGHTVGMVDANVAASRLPNQSVRVATSGAVPEPVDQFPQRLAAATGGELLSMSSRLPEQLAAIARQQDEYYRVSYVPPPSKEGACHSLRVKVNARGFVRARTQYCTEKAVDLVAGRIAGQALDSAEGTMEATMQLPYFYTGTNRASVHLSLELKPREAPKGLVDVVGTARMPDGGTAARFADSTSFSSAPYRYEHQFAIAAGKYNFQLAAGAGPGAVAKIEMPLEIAPWQSGTFGMGGIAFGTEAPPAASAEAGGPILEGRTPLVAAGRRLIPSPTNRFQRSGPVYFYTEIYDPALGAALTLQYRVLDRVTGEVRQDTGMVPIPNYVRPGNPVVPFATRIPVAQLAAGAYRLEVRASHSTGGETVIRTADFDLR